MSFLNRLLISLIVTSFVGPLGNAQDFVHPIDPPAARPRTFISDSTIACVVRVMLTLRPAQHTPLKELKEKPGVPVTTFNGEVNETGSFDITSTPWYQRDKLYVGVTNAPMHVNSGGGAHHYYIVAGGAKIHLGNRQEVTFTQKQPGQPQRVHNGVVFKIHADAATIEAVRREAKQREDKVAANCAQGTCEILHAAGIQIGSSQEQFLVTPKLLAASLLTGDVKVNGQKVSVEMLQANERELANFIGRAAFAENKRRIQAAGILTLGIVSLGYGLKAWFLTVSSEPTPSPSPSDSPKISPPRR